MEALILSHGKVSKHLESSEAPERAALVNACCALLKEKYATFMEEHSEQPLLLQFSADTTPLRVRLSHTLQSSTKSTRRTSSATSDLLVAHVTLVAKDVAGVIKQAILFKEPLPLIHGKTGPALAAAFLETPGLLSMQSNMGTLRLFHSVFDLGIPLLAQKYVSGRVFMKAVQAPGTTALALGLADAEDYDKQELHHLHTTVGCACHCAHNSLKWALHDEFEDTSLLKDIHVAFSSARACYIHVTTGILDWLYFALDPKEKIHLPSPDDLQALWIFLGLDFELVEQLARWRIICRSDLGYLELDAEVMRSESIEELTTLLLQVWRHEGFTASRWATMGTSSRCMIRSRFTGFDSCLKFLHSHDFYCAAFLALNNTQKRLLTILPLSAVQQSMCFALSCKTIACLARWTRSARTSRAFEYLSSLPSTVWSLLAHFCEEDLHSQTRSVCRRLHLSGLLGARSASTGVIVALEALPLQVCP